MLWWSRAETPPVVPVRGHLEGVRRMKKGGCYIGRGWKQRGLMRSDFANPHKVSVYGRSHADSRPVGDLRGRVWLLSGCQLVCRCTPAQECHADILIKEYRRQFPSAYGRDLQDTPAPLSSALYLLSCLREEPDSTDRSSADETAPTKTAGWRGTGKPMEVGLGYTTGDLRRTRTGIARKMVSQGTQIPKTTLWKAASEPVMDYTRRHGTTALLTRSATGQVTESPF